MFDAKVVFSYLLALSLSANANAAIKGDLDKDGVLSYKDAVIVARISLGHLDKEKNIEELRSLADFDKNGKVDANDAIKIADQLKGNGDVDADGEFTKNDIFQMQAMTEGAMAKHPRIGLIRQIADIDGNGTFDKVDIARASEKLESSK